MTVGVGGGAAVGNGVEDGGAGTGGVVSGRTAGGELVAGAFVAAMLISPGPGMVVLVSVCARRRFADKKRNPRTIGIDRHELPPYKDVKIVISQPARK
jgi:hypothetical protein